jgi:hypothetical protein
MSVSALSITVSVIVRGGFFSLPFFMKLHKIVTALDGAIAVVVV